MIDQTYINTIDIYPLEAPEQNKLHKFYEYLREGRLTATRCKQCGSVPWPPRTVCPGCYSDDLEWIDLPKRARLYAFTTQWGGVPTGFDVPLMMGLLDFEGGLRMLSRIVDAKPEELEIGGEVEFTVLEVPGNRVVHAFKPVRA